MLRAFASSLALPILLTAGLATAPTTCLCGAGVPHTHSLFQLPGHHHRPDDRHEHWNEVRLGTASADAEQSVAASNSPGPKLTVAHGSAGDRAAITPSFRPWFTTFLIGLLKRMDLLSVYLGRTVTPEPPPPRLGGYSSFTPALSVAD
jgi:hypothetical protein